MIRVFFYTHYSSNFTSALWSWHDYSTDQKTTPQRSWVTCLKSYCWEVAEPGFKSSSWIQYLPWSCWGNRNDEADAETVRKVSLLVGEHSLLQQTPKFLMALTLEFRFSLMWSLTWGSWWADGSPPSRNPLRSFHLVIPQFQYVTSSHHAHWHQAGSKGKSMEDGRFYRLGWETAHITSNHIPLTGTQLPHQYLATVKQRGRLQNAVQLVPRKKGKWILWIDLTITTHLSVFPLGNKAIFYVHLFDLVFFNLFKI